MKKHLISLFVCLFMASLAWAQTYRVTGTVTAKEDGQPVIGATVLVQGTALIATTDFDGKFVIDRVPQDATTLAISYIGMKTIEMAIAPSVTIIMETDANILDEVVITAQGLSRKQKAIGYSAQQLSSDELTITRNSDLGNSLAGKISGAQFWGSSGATFDSGTIVLRGSTSYSDARGSAPIYVIDGTIASANTVNMDDVESINVLKGPSATALYGSRGANGAVIITTKRAQDGKATIDFSHTTSVETFYNQFELNTLYGGGSLNAQSNAQANAHGAGAYDYTSAAFLYGQVRGWDLGNNTYYMDYASDENWGARFDPSVKMASALYWDPTSSKYQQADPWEAQLDMKDLTRDAITNSTNISFSKSGKDYTMRVSFSNVDRQGVMYNSNAVRRYLSINTSFKPASWLNVDLSYKFTYRKNKNGATQGYSAAGNVICDFTQWGQTNVNISDYKDYLRPDGSWRTWNIIGTDNLNANFHDNPYATMDNYNITSSSKYSLIAADVYANLPANLKLGVRVNANLNSGLNEYKYGSGSINWVPYFRTYHTNTQDIQAQGYLTWGDTFASDRLSVEAALFVEQRAYHYYYLNSNTNGGLAMDGYFNLASSASTYSTNNTEQHFKTRSAFATATVGWDDTFFLDLSIREDIDSRLNDDANNFLYGGGSLSIMLNKFLPKAEWLNFWKLRGSFAQVGSTLGVYNIYPTYTIGTKYGNVSTMSEPTTQKNRNIQPTISTSYEIGTEFKMFHNRFYGDINIYRKDTKNQIVNANVLPQSGYSYRTMNAGLVRNQGIEVMLGATPVRNKNVEWNFNFNIAKNVNTLVKLTDDNDAYTIYWSQFNYPWYIKAIEGKPIGVLSTGARVRRDENGNLVLRATTASQKNSYGEVRTLYETNVEKEVGNVQPDFTGGFSTSLRFKNFVLGASIDFVVGGQMVSWTNMWGTGSGVFASSAKLNNRGVNEREPIVEGGGVYLEGVDEQGNPISGYETAYQYYHQEANYDNDAWVYDRTYVKLRELSLAYEFSPRLLQKAKIGLSRASIAFVANNPWLIYSAVPNLDPSEIGGASYNYLEGGQAISSRTFGATLKLTF